MSSLKSGEVGGLLRSVLSRWHLLIDKQQSRCSFLASLSPNYWVWLKGMTGNDLKHLDELHLCEIGKPIGSAVAVLRSLYWSVLVKAGAQFSYEALCILVNLYIPIRKYDHELWVVTERIRSWVQVVESYFPLQGCSGCFSVKVWGAREHLRVKLLLLWIQRRHVSWFGHLTEMLSGWLHLELYQGCPTEWRPLDSPRTCRGGCISWLAWECPGMLQEGLESVAQGVEKFRLMILACCYHDPHQINN